MVFNASLLQIQHPLWVYYSFQLIRAMDQAYVISQASKDDISKLLRALGNVRALLGVQVSLEEEEILKASIW